MTPLVSVENPQEPNAIGQISEKLILTINTHMPV